MRLRVLIATVCVVLAWAARVDAQTSSATLSSVTCPGTGCLSVDVTAAGDISVQITGTFTGTIVFEKTTNGTTWAALTLTSLTGTSATSTTTTGTWTGDTDGSTDYRIRFSIYWSGSAAVSYNFVPSGPTAASLGALTTGLLKNTVADSVGTLSTAVAGTDYLAVDAGLVSIAGLTTAADRMIYTTALDTYAVTTLTSFVRSLLDDADASTARATLGVAIGTDVQALDADLTALAGINYGTAGTFVRATGSGPGISTLVLPNACATGRVLHATSTDTIGCVAGLSYTAAGLVVAAPVTVNVESAFATTVSANQVVTAYAATNSSAGTAAASDLRLTTSAGTFALTAFSELFTTSGSSIAGSIRLNSPGAGGITLRASHASGDVRIYNRSGVLAATWGASQALVNTGSLAWGTGQVISSSDDVAIANAVDTISGKWTFTAGQVLSAVTPAVTTSTLYSPDGAALYYNGAAVGAFAARVPFHEPPGLSWFTYIVAPSVTTGLPTVYNGDGSEFDVADLAPSGVATYYVATTGNDTTGDGSVGNPWLTINKCAVTAATNDTCMVAAGTYNVTAGIIAAGVTNKNLSIVGAGSVIISGHVDLTWALQTGSTYVATQASAEWVWDAATVDSYGDFAKLTLQASIAAVDANPGSYYISGTSVYVRTSDSRNLIGDTNIRVFVTQAGIQVRQNSTVYLENLTVHGPRPFVDNVGVGQVANLYMKNTTWKYRKNTGLSSAGGTTIIQDSVFARMESDGLNYDNDANGVGAKTIEINVTSRDNGYDGGVTNNGSSMHGVSSGVRVRGEYTRNVGPNVVDVGTAVTWNVGVWSHDSNSGVTSISDSNFYSQALMWLDSVVSNGSSYDLVVDTASTTEGIRVRSVTSLGLFSIVTNGLIIPW